jgi:trigger factor
MEELIKSTLQEAVEQQQLRIIDIPQIELLSNEDATDGDVRYAATFEVYPEVNLAPMGDWVVHRPEALLEESDVDTMQEALRHQRQAWVPVVDRPAMFGDRVRVDFTSTLADGKDFSGNTGNDVLIVLGDGAFVTGFERHLVGAVVGETRTAEVTFPLGHHHFEVAGKSAIFKIVVKSVESARLPELDEEFIRNFGVAEGTIEALRQSLRANMEWKFAQDAWGFVKNQVMDALYQHNPIDLPNKLVMEEVTRLQANLAKEQPPLAVLEGLARRNMIIKLLIDEIILRQGLIADPERVRAHIRILAQEFEVPDEVERAYLSDDTKVKEVESLVLEDMAIEWVLGQVQVKAVPASYSALMNSGSGKPIEKAITS